MADEQQLNEQLQQLHTELDKTEVADEASREKIQGLRDSIQPILDPNVETQPHHYHSLRERLSDAIDHFELTHPQLTLTLGEVLNNLAAIGL